MFGIAPVRNIVAFIFPFHLLRGRDVCSHAFDVPAPWPRLHGLTRPAHLVHRSQQLPSLAKGDPLHQQHDGDHGGMYIACQSAKCMCSVYFLFCVLYRTTCLIFCLRCVKLLKNFHTWRLESGTSHGSWCTMSWKSSVLLTRSTIHAENFNPLAPLYHLNFDLQNFLTS